MALRPSSLRRGPVRVVLARTTLRSLTTSWRAAALALVELGGIAFFASGVADGVLGEAGAWFVLMAVGLSLVLRAVDLESCALFVRRGLHGEVEQALGPKAAATAVAAQLANHLLLGTLAAVVVGHYVALPLLSFLGEGPLRRQAAGDLSQAVAVALVGFLWWWQRQGRSFSVRIVTTAVSVAVAPLALTILWALGSSVAGGHVSRFALPSSPIGLLSTLLAGQHVPGAIWKPVAFLTALGYCLCALGSGEALAHIAPELRQPRIRQLQWTSRLLGLYALVATAGVSFLVVAIVPAEMRAAWLDAPVAALALQVRAPFALRLFLLLSVVVAAVFLLASTLHRAAVSAQGLLSRLSDDGVLAPALRALHTQFETPWRLIDLTATAQIGILLVSGGQVSWLARAYAVAVAWSELLRVAALIRFRLLRPQPRAFRMPGNLRIGGREWPIGLMATSLALGVPTLCVLAAGDPATLAGVGLIVGVAGLLIVSERSAQAQSGGDALEEFQVLPSVDIDAQPVDTRPGNFLVPVRKPHSLAHLSDALLAAKDRDVVAMTVRLLGLDVPDDPARGSHATEDERRLFSEVVALAERHRRPVRLLIVPATNVFDAVAATALRLQSSEIHSGESETLSAAEQARLLGEAWERAPKPEGLDTRLVIHHASGRTATYHLGAHAPALNPDDLRLLHELWLDLIKTVGPHVHHHDVVRAALTHMEQQLNGPNRDEAIGLVRRLSRPADELAAVVRARDFGRLREMVRNWPAGDVAEILTDLALEDQVLVFRTLPRKVAATTFEYLPAPAQEALLKAMAQEDVASLLNDMAPDDRTAFLEELPAGVTRQLLALLTPEERSVASRLLGYREGTIGRLMTPDYIAIREDWTIQQVLDHVREHGQDSETLNVLYVVDDQGMLIDDIRIREFLLTSPAGRVADLMDRRFVALKATDDQAIAVTVFRREDRSALPVTDTAGVLIGIVTVDDVLDIAEAAATKDIQRVGGSEALDEPYISIAFPRMIQKRAGWLTALFLGEMLTATAMGFFEREIAKAVVLALFVPLIISSGGNAGSQASTLVIRAIALGEVQLKDWWRVMRREIGAGVALGAILGAIGFFRITVWSAFSNIYGEHWLLIAVTVSVALIGVVLWGTVIGSLLPLLLRRLGFDPATSSAPFVATLVDVTGLVIYFSVGLVILRGTLL